MSFSENDYEFKDSVLNHYIKKVVVISWCYYFIVSFIYLFISLYIFNVRDGEVENDLYATFVPLIVTTFIGGFSKNFYFNLIDYILNFNKKLMELDEINKIKKRSDGIINHITIMLLTSYLIAINDGSNLYLNIAIWGIIFILFLFVIVTFMDLISPPKKG